jgi:predicted O-methyltransferase YrrM
VFEDSIIELPTFTKWTTIHQVRILTVLSLKQISNIHSKYSEWANDSISPNEAYFIQSGIIKKRPKRFIEIGTSAGLATGLIGLFLQENGGEELFTLDLSKRYYIDERKPTGFLAQLILEETKIKVHYITGKFSNYIINNISDISFDMALIDANHQHPWPTLDTIALMPAMKSGALIYYHDLELYKRYEWVDGIGSKFLYDQVPENLKMVMDEPEANMYYIRNPERNLILEKGVIDSIHIPWTIGYRINDSVLAAFTSVAQRFWSERVAHALQQAAKKYNLKKSPEV